MEFLNSVIRRTSGYKTLINSVMSNELPVEVNGLSSVHKALLISALLKDTEKKGVLITPNEAEAVRIAEDLKELGINALILPSRDLFLGNLVSTSKEYEHSRINTLSKLLDGAFDLLCLSAESATQYTMLPETLTKNTLTLAVGDTAEPSVLIKTLISSGYTRCDLVEDDVADKGW